MMTFDPGGNIDQLGEGLRMAFGETVAAEPFNLLETAFGKIAFITALHHAAHHLVLIFVDRPHIAQSRHCPTLTIGLLRREFRCSTGALHSLFLNQWPSQLPPSHPLLFLSIIRLSARLLFLSLSCVFSCKI